MHVTRKLLRTCKYGYARMHLCMRAHMNACTQIIYMYEHTHLDIYSSKRSGITSLDLLQIRVVVMQDDSDNAKERSA